MPTYEYACPSCGIIEFFQSIKDEPLSRCPECKKCKVTRLFSGGGGVIFKGSGFWETDYNRSNEYRLQAKAESASGGGDDAASKPKAKSQVKKADSAPTAAGATTTVADPPAKR